VAGTSWDYEGQRVLLTGGTKGIGRVVVERFLAAGAQVLTCGRTAPDALPSAGGRTASFVACDVRDIAQLEQLAQALVDQHGGIDLLINNAGGSPHVDAATVSPRFSESIIALNLLAPLHLSQIVNRTMQAQPDGGVIINIGSVSGLRPSPGTAAYGAAKAGLQSLTRSLAVEWAPKVRVVSVIGGLIETEQAELHYGNAEGVAAVAATVPAGRMGTGDDVADACLFLGSPQASYTAGSSIVLDGGGERPTYQSAAEPHLRST
jgi:NAD(P)-dependent dehydrogenase (short-subunit alcohol dehydrogenase family)